MSDLSRPTIGHEAVIDTLAEIGDSELQSFRRVTLRFPSMSRASRRKEWSSEDLRVLRELAATGTPPDAIAVTLRRTESAVRNKAGMHGISLRGRR